MKLVTLVSACFLIFAPRLLAQQVSVEAGVQHLNLRNVSGDLPVLALTERLYGVKPATGLQLGLGVDVSVASGSIGEWAASTNQFGGGLVVGYKPLPALEMGLGLNASVFNTSYRNTRGQFGGVQYAFYAAYEFTQHWGAKASYNNANYSPNSRNSVHTSEFLLGATYQ